jgi:CRP/FNR family transcriptional regulator
MELKALIATHFGEIFEADLIREMAEVAVISKVKAGEILIDLYEEIDSMPLVIEGAIKISREDEDGHELFLYYIEAGTTCAATLTCCMNNQRSNILAVVEEDATFLRIPSVQMDQWMAKYSSWRKFILSNYAMRYDELLEVVDILAFKKMDSRILNFLEDKAKLNDKATVELSHQEIAYNLNTSREVVSRILKQLEKSGRVKLSRGTIKLQEQFD